MARSSPKSLCTTGCPTNLGLPTYPNFGRDAVLVSDMDGNGVRDLIVGCSEYHNPSVPMDSGAIFVTFLESDGQVLGHQRIGATCR